MCIQFDFISGFFVESYDTNTCQQVVNVEGVDNLIQELFHFVEVVEANTAGRIQKEENVGG